MISSRDAASPSQDTCQAWIVGSCQDGRDSTPERAGPMVDRPVSPRLEVPKMRQSGSVRDVCGDGRSSEIQYEPETAEVFDKVLVVRVPLFEVQPRSKLPLHRGRHSRWCSHRHGAYL